VTPDRPDLTTPPKKKKVTTISSGKRAARTSDAPKQPTKQPRPSPLSAAVATTRAQKTQVSDTAGHNSDGGRYYYGRVSRGESDVVLDSCVPWRRPPVLSSFPIWQVAFFGQPWSISLHGRAMRGPRSSAARSRRAGRRSRMSGPSSAAPHASLDEYLRSLPAGDCLGDNHRCRSSLATLVTFQNVHGVPEDGDHVKQRQINF
jgi:hypothetical protein